MKNGQSLSSDDPLRIIENLQVENSLLPEDLVIILGPTASGKTKLAVTLAKRLNGEIVSADSRQVYRQMDLGTGKDLRDYEDIPYHLIDIIDAGEQYHVSRFLDDFDLVYKDIRSRNKTVIVCGGTGFYIQSLLASRPYTQVPINVQEREQFENIPKDELRKLLLKENIPTDFVIDFSSRKRMIRALEIVRWLSENPQITLKPQPYYSARIIGLNPNLAGRRERISKRLLERLEEGMLDEARALISKGITYQELEYYGLEYKYMAFHLQGKMCYADFVQKLETEIHRYAKRQMTYFRKMEKDGTDIFWLNT